MIEVGVYSIFDKCADTFNTPFFLGNHKTAIRQFVDLANNPDTLIYKHPEDFTLYYLGLWKPIQGEIKPFEQKKIFEGMDIARERNTTNE